VIVSLAPLLAGALAASPCLPRADGREALRSNVCGLAGAYDTPVPDRAWRDLGPGADAFLAELAGSPDDLEARRARALEGLAARGGPMAERTHRALAASAQTPIAVRRGAIRGLGRLLTRAELSRTLRPLMSSASDPRARAAAAETLALHDPTGSCGIVRARAAADPSDAVRMESALSTCRAAAER